MQSRSKWQAVAMAFGAVALVLILVAQTAMGMRLETPQQAEEKQTAQRGEDASFCMLVVGRDRAAALCDVMMLVAVDPAREQVSVVQIPRDTYLDYGNASYKKINGAASYLGGVAPLCETLGQVLGVDIPYYVCVDTEAFAKVVDAVGGVRICLPYAMDYEDPADGLSIHLPVGEQVLDGESAMHFVRFRSAYVRGDLGRMDAQKVFLSAMLTQARQKIRPSNMLSVADAVFDEMETNLPFSHWLLLCKMGYSTSLSDVQMLTMPGADVRSSVSGAWFYVLSRKGCVQVVRDYLFDAVDEASFDAQRQLLPADRQEFSDIYESEASPEVYDAEQIGKNGLQIATITTKDLTKDGT